MFKQHTSYYAKDDRVGSKQYIARNGSWKPFTRKRLKPTRVKRVLKGGPWDGRCALVPINQTMAFRVGSWHGSYRYGNWLAAGTPETLTFR